MLPRQSDGERLLMTRYGAASASRQCAAAFIDLLLLAVTSVAVYLLTRNVALTALWAFQCVVLMAIVEGTRGATPSKALMGLRSVRADGLVQPAAGVMPAGMRRITIKYLVLMGCGCIPVIGLLVAFASPLFSKDGKQGWAERLAGIVIVDVHDASLVSVERTMRGPAGHADVSAADDSLDMRLVPDAQHRDSAVNRQVMAMAERSQHEFPQAVAKHAASSYRPDMPAPAVPVAPIAVPPAPVAPTASVPEGRMPNIAGKAGKHGRSPIAAEKKPTGERRAHARLMVPDLPSRPAGDVASAAQTPQLLLFFENAQGIPLASSATIVLGRKPQKQSAGDMLIPVKDDTGTVSRNHVRMEIENGRIWLTDLGSTNGTQVICDGEEKRLDAHVRTEISSGTRISLGDVGCSIATSRKGTRA
ncbi:FHA domain-containing protein [Bifidobacterium castoris]|uniref:Signal peptide protein n=1 Tax=Bifidobacterium castoris TaxID=2306972 RepID=A0A430F658_9BIFI|nr:FHA domain-containing protein [Bifidobacterium castoris]RSX47166.1 signal peptide protein [Bifidobacterium castoris]